MGARVQARSASSLSTSGSHAAAKTVAAALRDPKAVRCTPQRRWTEAQVVKGGRPRRLVTVGGKKYRNTNVA